MDDQLSDPSISPYKVLSQIKALKMNGMEVDSHNISDNSDSIATDTATIKASTSNLEAKTDTIISLLTTANGYLKTLAEK